MTTLELNVDGMSCSGCSGRLKRLLEANDGVQSAEIVLETKHVTVEYDEASIDVGAIHSTISDAGFTVMT